MQEIVYVSAARKLFDTTQLKELLDVARRNNARLGVSGILLYDAGSFIQVLEGEQAVVAPLFRSIAADDRHDRVRVVREREIAARSFSEWSMGFVSIDPRLVLPRRHGLSSNGTVVADNAAVLELLDAFRAGQWRNYVFG